MPIKGIFWSEEVTVIQEDRIISEFVQEKNFRKWTEIANFLNERPGSLERSGKQCRERWCNHLDPDIKKDMCSKEEQQKIFSLQKKFGNKWSKIAKFIPGRTENSVKNCFYSAVRKFIRKDNKKRPENGK